MNLKIRLSVLTFLEFGVWGAYLTCMGNYLGVAGLGSEISWFYAIQGIVSIFMPTLIGIVADKWIQPQRLLGLCHLVAGIFMLLLWSMGMNAGFGNQVTDKSLFIALYTLSVAFYMPTLALANTTAFTVLKNNGGDTVTDFPPIRSCGTVGFIIVMWFVNCATWDNGSFSLTLAQNAHKFQYTYNQFLVSGLLSIIMFLYVFTLPQCKIVRKASPEKKSLAQLLGLDAFKLFKEHGIFLHILSIVGNVSSGYQQFCRTIHLQFPRQFRCNHCFVFRSKQCHVAYVNIPSQRSVLHLADTFLPQAVWHKKRNANSYVCVGSALCLLRNRQPHNARCDLVHPFLHRLWRGIRLFQCLRWHIR